MGTTRIMTLSSNTQMLELDRKEPIEWTSSVVWPHKCAYLPTSKCRWQRTNFHFNWHNHLNESLTLSSAVTVIIIITVIITWIHLTTFPRVTIAAGTWRGRIHFSIKCVSWVNSLAIAYTLCYLLEKFPRLVGSPSAFVVVLPTSLYLASNLSHFRMHCYLDTTTSAALLNALAIFSNTSFLLMLIFPNRCLYSSYFSINKRTKRSSHFYSVALALPSADDAEACCSRSSTVPTELSFVSYSFTQIAWNCYFVHVQEVCALKE